MDWVAAAFYLFSMIACLAGFMVIVSRNPVHSVLWLILAFFSAAGLFVLMGAEFLAMLLMIVYVGAVAVLFLFVVMMLDVDFSALRGRMSEYLPIGGLVAVILLVELIFGIGAWGELRVKPEAAGTNTFALGAVIYTRYIYAFQASGLILLVAMIGAIVLTLRHRKDIRRQDVLEQMYRDPSKAVELKDIKPGQGL